MAQDSLLRSSAELHDISAGTESVVSTTLNLGKTGLREGMYVSVQCTEVTGQAVGAVTFVGQVSRDGGATWRDVGSRTVPQSFVATPVGQTVDFPVSFVDVQPEKVTDIRFRVRSRIAATVASADDFSFSWALGDAQGYVGPF